MGLTDKHLVYGDDIPQTQAEKDYYWALKDLKEKQQQPCEMTVEEYRNRLMDAFHNADCGELIAVVVRPKESEFKHLEWLLKNHYHKQKQQPCDDAISRQAVIKLLSYDWANRPAHKAVESVKNLPPVTPKSKSESEHDHEVVKAYNDGQAYILDKIKAEIERLTITEGGDDYIRKMAELFELKAKVLQIIDKYRG